jgi:hypothetical protein
MSSELELDATELEDLLCADGRAWLAALPPCLETSDVLELLAPAIAAWHAHELELDQ